MATGNSRNSVEEENLWEQTWTRGLGMHLLFCYVCFTFRQQRMVEKGAKQTETERLRLRQNPRTRWAYLCRIWIYQYIVVMKIHYMLLPKIESRIWLVPTFGLIDRSYIRCFRRTHKVCLVITNYSRGIPGSSPTQKSTSKQLYNWLGGKSILWGTARRR